MSPPPRLRVGLMLESLVVEAWVAEIVEQIRASDFLELAVVVVNAEARPARRSRLALLRTLRPHLLYYLYERRDYRRNRAAKDALAYVDLAESLAGIRTLDVVPVQPKPFEHRFPEEDLDALRGEGLDVLLRFGFRILRGGILECARYGVWSYHHGDNRRYRGGPPFFWEMYHGDPVTGTLLQVLTDDLDAGRVLYRSWSATNMLSLYRSRNAAYWKTAAFVIRRLADLRERGWKFLASLETYNEPPATAARVFRLPSNRQMAAFLAKVGLRRARSWLRFRLFRPQWVVALREHDGPWQVLSPPRDRFYADPFVLEHEGRHFVFFEEYPFRERRGFISYAVLDGPGSASKPRPALERPYHLSYPFVFAAGGDVYMIPETEENRTVELYRAVRFPDEWELERVLFEDVRAADATLLERDGRLWLFAALAVEGAALEDELFLFSGETLAGPWTPHPLNPIVSDVRTARPAGRIVVRDGALIRPAQDSSRPLDLAVAMNRVETLHEDEYRERSADRLGPELLPGTIAVHTYDAGSRYEAVDALRWRLRLPLGRRTPR